MTPERFPTTIRWENADLFADLVTRMTQPGYAVNFADVAFLSAISGNFRDARYHATPESDTPSGGDVGTLFPGGTPVPFGAYPNTVYSAKIGGDGMFTWSVGSGNEPQWASTSPDFPNDESKTRYAGGGSTDLLPVTAGQTVYMKHMGSTAKQARCSMG